MFGKHFSKITLKKQSDAKLGDKNHMYNMIWIHHPDYKLTFPVSDQLFWMYIGEGWRKGRIVNWDTYITPEQNQQKLKLKELENKSQKELKLKLLYEYFDEYQKTGFDGVVKKFNYQYTRNNLIMSFKKYISEYIPVVCNRWKHKQK